MDEHEKIAYHSTQAFIHLSELANMKLACLSPMNKLLLGDTINLVDELAKRHSYREV